MRTRTPERMEFLTDVLITAVESGPYGWFDVDEYQHSGEPGTAYAVVSPNYDPDVDTYTPGKPLRIDLDVVARGLGVIRNAKPKLFGEDEVLANSTSGERLYLSSAARKDIMGCDRENDAGEIDVIYALAIVECGLFGRVVYA